MGPSPRTRTRRTRWSSATTTTSTTTCKTCKGTPCTGRGEGYRRPHSCMVVRRRSVGGRTKYSPAPGSEALAGRRKVDGTESREPQTPKTKNVVELKKKKKRGGKKKKKKKKKKKS